MKQRLLIASLLLSGASFAQFTQTNEPAIGTSQVMYLCDSNATDYAGTTGTGVTWDYSTTPKIYQNTKTLSVVAASTTPEASYYTSASTAVQIPGFVTSYFNSSASSRNSKGFSFDGGGSFGIVSVVLDANDELLMNYPYAQGNTLTDAFSGQAYVSGSPNPTTGNVTTTVDGTGTLILNGSTTISNVVRFKVTEQASAVISGIIPVQINRLQFEYYDLANSTLPLFVHSTLTINVGGTPSVQHIVLNSVQPDQTLSLNQATLANVSIYPNPATETVRFSGLKNDASVSFVDIQGKTVLTAEVNNTATSVDVSNLNSGVYFVTIQTVDGTATQRVVVQ